MKKTYDEWFNELKEVAVEKYGFTTADDFDYEAWRAYYETGDTPDEAMAEDVMAGV